MSNLKAFALLIFIGTFTMCTNETSPFNEDLLEGSWKVDKWTIESTGKTRTNKMDMNFKNDMSYEIDYGPESERGRYWISGIYLHTFEKGETEKKVKLIKLVSDTLEIQMNRAGEMENVLLIKK